MTHNSGERPEGWVKGWDGATYMHAAGDVYGLAGPLFAKLLDLKLKPGSRVLDMGCGEGRITKLLMHSKPFASLQLEVVGIDYSESMVEKAVERGINATQMDASKMIFDKEFDVVFSLSAIHWVQDAEGVAHSVAKALKPGGHFVAEFGRRSPPAIVDALLRVMRDEFGQDVSALDPWRKTTATEWKQILRQYAFASDQINVDPVERHVLIPGGMKRWLETFVKDSFLSPLSAEDKEKAMNLVVEELKGSHLFDPDNNMWYADYQRLAVTAQRSLQQEHVPGRPDKRVVTFPGQRA